MKNYFGIRMNLQLLQRSTPLLVVLMLAGCASFTGINPHAVATQPVDLGLNSINAAAVVWPDDHEWDKLKDPVLSDLMKQALANSPTIKIAQARLAMVSAMVNAADAQRYPEVGVSASVTPEHFTANGLYPPPFGGSIYSTDLLMVNARYEFDFWGKNRDALAAALSNEKAALAEIQTAQVVLETSVATSYFTLARGLAQKAILEKTLAQRDELFNVSQQRHDAGLETRQDLQTSRQGLPAIRADLIRLDEQISLARNALAALIGKGPAATENVTAALPTHINMNAPDNIPAELIGHRADIAAAVARVQAASKEVSVSKAEFYPDINISAFAGFSSLGFAHWLDRSSRDYGVGPAISLPIFDAGRLRANLSSKTAEYDLAVESYNEILIEAVHDVADQLSSLRALGLQQKQQAELLRNAESIYHIAEQREQAGLINHTAVLNAQTNLLAQQSADIDLKTRAVDLNINLVRALGGGFHDQTVTALAAKI